MPEAPNRVFEVAGKGCRRSRLTVEFGISPSSFVRLAHQHDGRVHGSAAPLRGIA